MTRETLKLCYFRMSLVALFYLLACTWAQAQGSAFTYQGRLTDATNPAEGMFDIHFKLFDTPDVGTGAQQGLTVTYTTVQVTNGVFTVQLDFGLAVFNGSARYIEISIRPTGNLNPHIILGPRQPLTSTPYSVRSLSAAVADNATQLSGQPASGYIQNTTMQQGATNFNIGGTGTANVLNAATQFNLGGSRILDNEGTRNLFAGINAGLANSGFDNSFFGNSAGFNNSTGTNNSFFGSNAGRLNTMGGSNSFFGTNAGESNTTGVSNSFFGNAAGLSNSTGNSNSFFGEGSGIFNTASDNSFFGWAAGFNNTSGGNNVFIGSRSGISNTQGLQNAFVGGEAGTSNTTGSSNTYFGYRAGFSNTSTGGNTFFGWRAGLNSTGGGNTFFGSGSGVNTTTGNGNTFFGGGAGTDNLIGSSNSFFGGNAGTRNTTGNFNTFLGPSAGAFITTGGSNVFIGNSAGPSDTSTQVSNSVAIGAFATVTTSNTIVLGTSAQTTRVPGFMNVGDNPQNPGAYSLQVISSAIGGGVVGQNLYIRQLNQTGSPAHLCWKVAPDGVPALLITTCTSSLSSTQYKTDLQPFSAGLNVITRLKPKSFRWKEDGASDFGLNAEDVAEVEPLLVTRNAKGEVTDVKHENTIVVLINAVKQQQHQIENQQAQIELLKRIICLDHPDAEICKPSK